VGVEDGIAGYWVGTTLMHYEQVNCNGEPSSHSHVGAIISAVLGAVLGLLLLLLLIIFLPRWQRGQRPHNYRLEPPTSQVMWMWHDVHRDDDQDTDLYAQFHSDGEASPASPQSSVDEHNAFLRHGRDTSHGTRDPQSTARLVDAPRRSHNPSGPTSFALASGSKPNAGDSGC
jgi:hypothetical protein